MLLVKDSTLSTIAILDILLIEVLGELNYPKTRIAVERVFAERGTHALPTTFEIPAAWQVELETLAHSLGFPIKDITGIAEKFQDVLNGIVVKHSGT